MSKRKRMNKKPPKPFWEMTPAELDEATKEFDEPICWSKCRPLTKAERARFEKMRAGPSVSIFLKRAK